MSGRSDEPPGLSEESGSPGASEQEKSPMMDYKDIMLKSKLDLKKKEEEVQEYANKLSKIKSRTKMSRRSLEASSSSLDSAPSKKLDMSLPNIIDEDVTDISEAKTPKEKSNLLQKKLAENRKMFEQRSKEITESNRAVEEKVEAIRQQIDETDLLQKDIATTIPVKPILIMPQLESSVIREKDNKIMELDMKIHQLEAIIIDLQDNLKEKDSVIDARTKAITLMSEDLSKKGKTTLDTLEETKDEMRSMQSNFILMETSLKDKNDHLLSQLGERTDRIAELEETVNRFSSDHSKSDTNMITDLRAEMSLMQENFVLIESSLKDKIKHLMSQLEERERKLSEADEKMSTFGNIENFQDLSTNERMKELQDQFDEMGEKNRSLEYQKKELEKSLVDLAAEKDNKITELENRLQENAKDTSESETIRKLTKELDDLNKNMIKLKAQHKTKLKNLQKRLDSFKAVSDVNAELVKLGNQVALLEEEKGNLQLSLVDFDELKASTVELQTRVSELEEKLLTQANDIQSHVDAIATLENHKLDLMQELHAVKQEVSALEAENADSENLRVTAELKVVELEEQFDSLQKSFDIKSANKSTIHPETDETGEKIADLEMTSSNDEDVKELRQRLEILMERNQELEMQLKESHDKGSNIDKKSSDTDSTESFERISDENSEVVSKLSILEEQESEIPETMTQSLHRRIENLVLENSDLVIELTKVQEKFDSTLEEKKSLKSQINELTEQLSKLDNLTRENSNVVMKLTNVELENAQLKNNLDKLLNNEALITLETEILHCKQINEKQLQLVQNVELSLQNSEKDMDEKNKEIEMCQRMVTNFTIMETNYLEMEKMIQDLKEDKSTIVEKMRVFEEENSELLSKLKLSEEDAKSSVYVFSEKIIHLETKLIEGDSMIEKQQKEMSLLNENIEKNLKLIEELKQEGLEMKQIIDGFENEKIVISENIGGLKGQLEFKEDAIAALGEEFKTTVQIMENQLRDKEMILMSLHNQVPELQEALEEKDKEIADLQNEMRTLQKISEDTDEMFTNYKDEISSLQETIREKEIMLSELQKALSEKEKSLDEKENHYEKESLKQSELLEVQSEIEQLKNKLKEREDLLELTKSQSEENINSIEANLQDARDLIGRHEESIRALESTLAEKEETITNLRQENVSLIEKVARIEANLIEKDNKSEVYLQTIERLSNEIGNYKTQIDENEKTMSELREEIASLDNIIGEFRSNTNLLEGDVVSLKEQLRSQEIIENKNKEILQELDENEKSIRYFKGKIEELTEENQQLRLQIDDMNHQLMQFQETLPEKENLISSLIAEKDTLMHEISEKSAWMENQTKYIEEIRSELNDAYKMMEQLKKKHVEDIEMMNNRTQDLFEELDLKSKEFSDLKIKLEEQETIISQNLADDIKKSLEERIVHLESQLGDANNSAQSQLQKMKIIAANLKKKSHQCQEWEAKATDFANQLAKEKSEKEEMNLRIQMAEKTEEEKSLRIEELERQILEAQNEAKNANENVEKLANEIDLTRDKIESLLQEVATLMSEIAKKHHEVEEKSAEIDQLKHMKDALESELEEFKNTRSSEISSAEETIGSLENQLGLANEKIRDLTKQINRLEEVHQEIESHMEQMTSEIERKSSELQQRAMRIDEQASKTEQKSYEIEKQSLEIEKQSAEIEKKLLEMQDRSLEIEKKSTEIEDKIIEIEKKSLEIEEKKIEIAKKSSEIEDKAEELEKKSAEIDHLTSEFASYKDSVISERSKIEQVLEETTERARELGVRMQVMENEYVEQLNTIQNLRTENGLLMSKHAQINERLENAEVESADRQKIIESLQGEITKSLVAENVEIPAQHCDYCDRCQGLVNMLEAKLQERNAEIENLDNELANSIGNFLQMRETLRSNEMMRTQQEPQRGLEDSAAQCNELLVKNSELEAKIRELNEQIAALSGIAAEAENFEKLRNDLLETCRIREIELDEMKNSSQELEAEKRELLGKIETLQNQQTEKTQGEPLQESSTQEGSSIVPKLFDASKLFTSSAPWDLGNTDEISSLKKTAENHEIQCNQLSMEIERLNGEIRNYKEEIEKVNAKNAEIIEEKLQLIQSQQEQQAIYGNNEKMLTDNLRCISEENINYISTIQEFISVVKNTTNESSLELPSKVDSTIVRSKFNLILTIIDGLKSKVSEASMQLVDSKAKKEIIQEEVKSEQTVQLTNPMQPCYDEIKLDDDEEVWGWNSQEAELSSTPLAPICSSETQLEAKVAELEDTIKDLEGEKAKLSEEIKVGQVRSGKLVKKLKEFKIQNESLQQQLKLQLSSGGLCDLDSAIQEELKGQVEKLEKSLSEIKNENEKIVVERDQLVKRIDVLMAGHERFTEMKERQDREVEVLQIRNKELSMKIEYFEKEFPEKCNVDIKEIENKCNSEVEEVDKVSREKFDELQESLELLATENDELRILIEDEKNLKLAVESQLNQRIHEVEVEKNQRSIIEAKLISLEQDLQRRIQELESQIDEKNARVRILEESLENSQRQFSEISDSLENVTELLNARVQEVANLKTQMQTLQMFQTEDENCHRNVEDLDRKLQAKDEEIGKTLHDKEEEMCKQLSDKEEEIKILSSKFHLEMQEKVDEILELSTKIDEINSERIEMISRIDNQSQEILSLKENLDQKEWLLEKLNSEVSIEKQKNALNQEDVSNSFATIAQLQKSVAALEQDIIAKNQELSQKEEEMGRLHQIIQELQNSGIPSSGFEDNSKDKAEIAELRTELSTKLGEIEDLKYILNESTYPRILQELQDNINQLYDEKLKLETALASAQQKLQSQSIEPGDSETPSNIQNIQSTDQTAGNLQEMEKILKFKEEEIGLLTRKLETKNVECSLLENALAKQLPSSFVGKDGGDSGGDNQNAIHLKELTSSELDVALYMLHQRDVRCEELTHELMQLLEERDTLQLRLSNAIRSNEELRRIVPAEARSDIENMPIVEEKSPPRKSDSEERVNLAEKLSQLHNVGHRRDVRLMDDRELRHTQQMSLLAHKDALSTLPPDAAARLINANYTLSRDVQSQSSVLMNWLWGKSTPKVVHM